MTDERPQRRFSDRHPGLAVVDRLAPYFLALIYILGSFIAILSIFNRLNLGSETVAALAGTVMGALLDRLGIILRALFQPKFNPKGDVNAEE